MKIEGQILRKLDDGDVWRKEIETANCNEVYIFVKISIIAHRLFNGLVH